MKFKGPLLLLLGLSACERCHFERECIDRYRTVTRTYYYDDGSYSHTTTERVYDGTDCFTVEVCEGGW